MEHSAQHLAIELKPGKFGPKYQETIELKCEKAIITEMGTEKDLPFVDFVMKDQDGKKYLLVLTGRIVLGLAGAIKGVNLKNHGDVDP